MAVANFLELIGGKSQRMFPGGRLELAFGIAHERLAQAVGVLDEIEAEAALGAEKITVDPALVAVIGADNLGSIIGLADSEGYLASVAAVGADGCNVIHLPRTRFIAIAAAGQRAHRADVYAHAAFFTVQLRVAIGCDDGTSTTVLHAKCPDIHTFAAYADAAVTKDTAGAVVEDCGRPLLLVTVLLGLFLKALARTVLEGHVLQFALAARIADRAVERVIAKQQLDGGFASLCNFRRLGDEDLALGDGRGAGGLQLGHFFLAHDAHAAGRLQAEPGVVAEGWNFDARLAAGLNEQSPRWCGQLLSIDCEGYVCHSSPAPLKPKLLLRVWRTGRASRPGDLQTPCGISLQSLLSAWPLRHRVDRRCGPTCFRPGIECCRCLCRFRIPHGSASGISSASLFLRGRGCTSRSFRDRKRTR